MTFGKRMREERNKLGLNQTDFGALGGLTKNTIIDYEKDIGLPNTKFLLAIAASGADVGYILTGQRAGIGEYHPGYRLRPEHKTLLDNFDKCCKQDQDAIRRLALLAAEATDIEEAQPSLNEHELGQDDDENK